MTRRLREMMTPWYLFGVLFYGLGVGVQLAIRMPDWTDLLWIGSVGFASLFMLVHAVVALPGSTRKVRRPEIE